MGLDRRLFPVPVLTPGLSAWWLVLFSPVPLAVASALIQGLRSETVVQNTHARDWFPHLRPMAFEDSVRAAVREIEENQVLSRWCDSSGGAVCDLRDADDTSGALFRDRREFDLGNLPTEAVFRSVCTLGGRQGWPAFNGLWRFRGILDKAGGGYGLSRGRRDPVRLRTGDALDFWKVADLREGRRLLLFAQMKVPGKAWLEFDVRDRVLVQTAHFYPRGLAGRVYWAAMLPLHHLIFARLGRRILDHARTFGSAVNLTTHNGPGTPGTETPPGREGSPWKENNP
jgi:hypothetical protein